MYLVPAGSHLFTLMVWIDAKCRAMVQIWVQLLLLDVSVLDAIRLGLVAYDDWLYSYLARSTKLFFVSSLPAKGGGNEPQLPPAVVKSTTRCL